ncbi:MAG: hypothetical protein V3U24_05210 [Candidatus Neomarinimicrobiota bacterium]
MERVIIYTVLSFVLFSGRKVPKGLWLKNNSAGFVCGRGNQLNSPDIHRDQTVIDYYPRPFQPLSWLNCFKATGGADESAQE